MTHSVTKSKSGNTLTVSEISFQTGQVRNKQPIYRDGDCRPDDPDSRWDRPDLPKPLQAVEIVLVVGNVDIRFGNFPDAAYALAHLRKIDKISGLEIIVRAI